jgi:hypothetical protein
LYVCVYVCIHAYMYIIWIYIYIYIYIEIYIHSWSQTLYISSIYLYACSQTPRTVHACTYFIIYPPPCFLLDSFLERKRFFFKMWLLSPTQHTLSSTPLCLALAFSIHNKQHTSHNKQSTLPIPILLLTNSHRSIGYHTPPSEFHQWLIHHQVSLVPTWDVLTFHFPHPQNFLNFRKLWVVCHPWVDKYSEVTRTCFRDPLRFHFMNKFMNWSRVHDSWLVHDITKFSNNFMIKCIPFGFWFLG